MHTVALPAAGKILASAWIPARDGGLVTAAADELQLRNPDGEARVTARLACAPMAIAADEAHIALATTDGEIHLLDHELRLERTVESAAKGFEVTHLALSERLVAAGYRRGVAAIWDRASGKGRGLFRLKGWATGVALHGARVFATCSGDQLWSCEEASSPEARRVGSEGWENFARAVFVQDARHVVVASRSRQVRRIDVQSGRTTHLLVNDSIGDQVAAAASDRVVVVADHVGGFRAWDLDTRLIVDRHDLPVRMYEAVSVAPDSQRAFFALESGEGIIVTR